MRTGIVFGIYLIFLVSVPIEGFREVQHPVNSIFALALAFAVIQDYLEIKRGWRNK
jgi:hypothetical protein